MKKNMVSHCLGMVMVMAMMTTACTKKLLVNEPTVTITVDTTKIYTTTDTVNFVLSGYADDLAVWTGDSAHSYANRNRTTSPVGNVMMLFNTQNEFDVVNGLQLLAATNIVLNPVTNSLDSTSVVNANWKDITSRLNLLTPTGSTQNYTVPAFSITDLISKPTDSLYFAFKYTSAARTTGQKPSQQWIVNEMNISNVLPNHQGVTLISAMSGLRFFSLSNPPGPVVQYPAKPSQTWGTSGTANSGAKSGTFFTVASNMELPAAGAPNNANSAWAVTNALVLSSCLPDYSVPIKNVGTTMPAVFSYKYAYPGTYTVTFLIQNNTVDADEAVIKQFTITVN